MKTLKKNRFLLVSILTVFAAVSAILGLSSFGKKSALAEDTASETFVMEDGVSAKLSNGGGIRFRVKMDETTGLSVKNGESALKIVVAPYYYFDKGVDYAIANGQKIDVEKAKVYQEGGAYYANGCITDIKEANRKLNLQAVAVISSGETVTKQTAVNVNAKGNMYDVLTSAVLDASGSYEKTIFKIAAYSAWFGTESYPITVLNDTEYTALVAKLAGEDGFKDKYYRIIKTVSGYNADDFSGISSNVELFKAANAITFADGSMDITYPAAPSPQATAKGGTVTYKYAAAKVENGKHVTVGELGDWNSVYNGAGTYCCIASTAGDDTYEAATAEKYFTVFKASNAISELSVADIKHGEIPAPASVSATHGTVTVTYANRDKTKTGAWEQVYEHPGQYYCIATVEGTADYDGATKEKLFTVHQAEGAVSFELNSNVLTCGNDLDYTVTSNANNVVVKYSVVENGEYKSLNEWLAAGSSDAVYNGKTYWAKAFIENDADYSNAQSTAYSFKLYHDFEDGICKGCGYAQTGITYEADGDVACVAGYAGNPSTELYVLKTYQGKPVTYVKSGAFNTDIGHNLTKVVLPSTITDLGGGVFINCVKLEYVDMRGITALTNDNNFLNCSGLRTVIVGNGYKSNTQQFYDLNTPVTKQLEMFVMGTTVVSLHGNDNMVKAVYYTTSAATVRCGQWKFGDSGEILKGAAAHNFVDGVCTICGEKNAMGVIYTYDSASGSYYVEKYTGSAETVTVFGTWNDGTHGEKPVTYVAFGAFSGNSHHNAANFVNCKKIKKIILPESVTDLGGWVFAECENLEYLDARGVKNIMYAINGGRPDGTNGSDNNFRSCYKLTTLIIGEGFKSNVGQFTTDGSATINLYVYGTTAITTQANDNALTGNIYYYSETESAGKWHFDENDVPALW